MSEALCGRSANRGCCAQPCRQAWDLLDSDGNTMLKNQYLLSLHDMDRSTLLRQMLDAGITTLKIEGRLKDEAYVRNITAYYRLLLDQLLAQPDSPYCRASKGNIHLDFTPNPEKTFHRGGIDYFLNGQPSPDTHYANFLTPKSTGEQVGKVLAVNGNNITVQVKKGITLHNGDGLCFGDKGFMINTARLTGNQQYLITTAEPVQIRPQETLFRNQDIEFLSRLRHTRTRRLLPADILLKETPNGFLLKIADRQKEFTADKVPAKNEERALQTVKEQLSKLGDTCYEAQSVSVVWQKPYFIPVSTLNDWRRQLTTLPYQDGNRENTEETESKETRIQSQPYCAPLPEVLMTCRYCLLRELGRCRKTHPRKDGAEPAYIRNGKNRFRLRFDCQQCQMQILRAD